MKRTLFSKIGIVALVLMVALLIAGVVSATEYTVTKSLKVNTKGMYWNRYSHTFAASTTDTMICNILASNGPAVDPALNFIVRTKDTAVVAVRYQVSADNVTWASLTIGTDSTTWANTSATVWKATPISINTGTSGYVMYVGKWPYSRILVYGYSASNKASTVYVDVFGQNE